ncbi:Uncharacterised protein [Mycobacteroides abscessus subsp. abscessus]|nr:Uncharacterised protein [Mycobacteroides abscessus subsp. abscessus]SKZ55155.1 Uncharacterised protein [Mycobacteroides abscessus subsp. abscessus]
MSVISGGTIRAINRFRMNARPMPIESVPSAGATCKPAMYCPGVNLHSRTASTPIPSQVSSCAEERLGDNRFPLTKSNARPPAINQSISSASSRRESGAADPGPLSGRPSRSPGYRELPAPSTEPGPDNHEPRSRAILTA